MSRDALNQSLEGSRLKGVVMIKITRSDRKRQRYNVEHFEKNKNSNKVLTTVSIENLSPLDLTAYLAKEGVTDEHIAAAYRSLKLLKSNSVYFNNKLELFYAS